MRIRGAIFDLDGTLLDSMRVWDDLGERYLLSIGVHPKRGLKDALAPMSAMQAAEYMKREYGLSADAAEIVQGFNGMIQAFYKDEALLKPGAVEALELFRTHGVKMCVATASDRQLTEAALRRNGADGYFCDIFSCGDIATGKDDPAFYEKALERLGTQKAETVVFEDALHAARTAKQAGFYVGGVYDESSQAHQAEMKALCDWYVLRLDEMVCLPDGTVIPAEGE